MFLPYIVISLRVEPSKPRLYHDDRLLNLLINDSSFHLEMLKNVYRLGNEVVYMVTTDKTSGYDHVRLSVESQRHFKIQCRGFVIVCTVLPI